MKKKSKTPFSNLFPCLYNYDSYTYYILLVSTEYKLQLNTILKQKAERKASWPYIKH